MKKGWKLKPLAKVCQIRPPKKEARELLTGEDLVSFVPMDSLGIDEKYFKAEKTKALSKVSSSYTYFKEGDVLLAKITPCFENGKLGIAKDLINQIGFGSSEYIVYRAFKELNNEYLYYFLNQESFRIEGASKMTGAVGHKRIPKDFYENYKIPIPPLPEQKQIVSILDKAFAAIDKAKTNIEKNIQNAEELFQSKLNQIFSQKGEGWIKRDLGDLGVLTSSKRIYKKEYVTEGVPFYRSKEIKQLAHNKNVTLELFISEERYNEIKEKFGIPQKGDILLTAVGTIGEMYIVGEGEKFYFKDGNIMWLKQFEDLDSYYLKYALGNFVEQLKALARGSAYSALTIEKLKKYSIPVPSIQIQQKIVLELDDIKEQSLAIREKYTLKILNLEELKKSLLQKAFTGELTKDYAADTVTVAMAAELKASYNEN
ncbi:MAG: restriction endonuclease subunit S [Bacteroidota bacterium]|nr:restriction endonuclease subunit S [Bacteroidota bacterium]